MLRAKNGGLEISLLLNARANFLSLVQDHQEHKYKEANCHSFRFHTLSSEMRNNPPFRMLRLDGRQLLPLNWSTLTNTLMKNRRMILVCNKVLHRALSWWLILNWQLSQLRLKSIVWCPLQTVRGCSPSRRAIRQRMHRSCFILGRLFALALLRSFLLFHEQNFKLKRFLCNQTEELIVEQRSAIVLHCLWCSKGTRNMKMAIRLHRIECTESTMITAPWGWFVDWIPACKWPWYAYTTHLPYLSASDIYRYTQRLRQHTKLICMAIWCTPECPSDIFKMSIFCALRWSSLWVVDLIHYHFPCISISAFEAISLIINISASYLTRNPRFPFSPSTSGRRLYATRERQTALRHSPFSFIPAPSLFTCFAPDARSTGIAKKTQVPKTQVDRNQEFAIPLLNVFHFVMFLVDISMSYALQVGFILDVACWSSCLLRTPYIELACTKCGPSIQLRKLSWSLHTLRYSIPLSKVAGHF